MRCKAPCCVQTLLKLPDCKLRSAARSRKFAMLCRQYVVNVAGFVVRLNGVTCAAGVASPAGNSSDLFHSFNAFSCGPRNCIGQDLARLEFRTALMILLSRFQFTLPPNVDPAKFVAEEQVCMVTLQPRHGLPLCVTPVQSL